MTDPTAISLWFAGGMVAGIALRFFHVLPAALRKANQ